jgi:hypothetical protein
VRHWLRHLLRGLPTATQSRLRARRSRTVLNSFGRGVPIEGEIASQAAELRKDSQYRPDLCSPWLKCAINRNDKRANEA